MTRQFSTVLGQINAQSFESAINGVIDAVNEYGANSSQVYDAFAELEAIIPGVTALFYDDAGAINEQGLASLQSADSLYVFISSMMQANIAAAQANYDNLNSQLQRVSELANDAAFNLQYMAASAALTDAKKQYAEFQETWKNMQSNLAKTFKGSGGGGGGAGSAAKSEADKVRDEFNKLYKDLQFKRDVNIIDQKTYLDQLDALNRQYFANSEEYLDDYQRYYKEVYQGMISWWEDALSATLRAVNYVIDKQIEALEDQKKQLQKENEERERALELERLQLALETARRNKSMRVYYADRGWVWEADQNAIKQAEEDIRQFEFDEQIRHIDEMIDKWEEYKKMWQDVVDEYHFQQDKLLADQMLGADWESKILDQRLDVLQTFADQYAALWDYMQSAAWAAANSINAAMASIGGSGGGGGGGGGGGSSSSEVWEDDGTYRRAVNSALKNAGQIDKALEEYESLSDKNKQALSEAASHGNVVTSGSGDRTLTPAQEAENKKKAAESAKAAAESYLESKKKKSAGGGAAGGSFSAFARGTKKAPGGPAIINDDVRSKNGSAAEIVDLPEGSAVYPYQLTKILDTSIRNGDMTDVQEVSDAIKNGGMLPVDSVKAIAGGGIRSLFDDGDFLDRIVDSMREILSDISDSSPIGWLRGKVNPTNQASMLAEIDNSMTVGDININVTSPTSTETPTLIKNEIEHLFDVKLRKARQRTGGMIPLLSQF